jgi:hypothetical protein
MFRAPFYLGALLLTSAAAAVAQEPPYFATYSDVLEEPGNLELASQNIYSTPKNANPFYGQTIEMEYGVTGWWTTEVYLQGQVTTHDSAIFTGFRFENRFRPLRKTHWINPVLYLEYEDVNQADKSFLEITGHDVIQNLAVSNHFLRRDIERSLETKIILSSYIKGVNISENFIAEKNLSDEPWEFGYAAGASRSLANGGSPKHCRLCRQNFAVGGEIFGGLGTRYNFGFRGTSIYAGPTVSYSAPGNWTILAGPEFGLNDNSAGVLWRLKMSREFNQVRDLFRTRQ